VVEYLQITGSVQNIVNLLTTDNRQNITAKHRWLNHVLWRVVAGRQLDNPDSVNVDKCYHLDYSPPVKLDDLYKKYV